MIRGFTDDLKMMNYPDLCSFVFDKGLIANGNILINLEAKKMARPDLSPASFPLTLSRASCPLAGCEPLVKVHLSRRWPDLL